MDLHTVRTYCLEKKGAIEDFPFGKDIHVFKICGKMFALLSNRNGSLHISLKCEPEICEILREQYPAIKPGYHLNKRHWNTIEADGSIPIEEIFGMIDRSYQLVFKGLKKAERELITNSLRIK
ncbi:MULTISPECIES: MmcQ/YjbR family DNA-binding protein [Aneurinibacillus]|uniref:MmcQ/YjbR family DNA-binding protein n=1 Tax=Aneurinibacillus thermoaerophilus TaxID=143495 RepID=A0A1G8BG20_ANETH|nr:MULTISPECIES: MmcQ/YjbR family DNA-binding protein [Aneurinibacillus]AMA71437.1 MmcQ-like protein [Aneurinibacillus sp. XH2]MED0674258.1 MmcQ/YjbR family DNA-binding protein [Aneurinibacillus thermoaerophilus]MED0678646.1 MmcQ/YjbR family DNA-binding protein [Aneurinibacillus thermoaerophilus]MED0737808.1 MmcQ/YjbR family DNA-binding protein [Aneurinibacillus thermoaerophilus]MED0755840.1 MmcQ/YjbR family DNA-binding protein [Aneurinibacillus thermoaerophilus]